MKLQAGWSQVLFNGMLENNCSEQASRMAAMESSTKNAKEMLSKLTLSYNRCLPQPRSTVGRAISKAQTCSSPHL